MHMYGITYMYQHQNLEGLVPRSSTERSLSLKLLEKLEEWRFRFIFGQAPQDRGLGNVFRAEAKAADAPKVL